MLWLWFACSVQTEDSAVLDTETQDEGYLYILSNYWTGEGDVVLGESYTGTETYYHNKGAYASGEYACILRWDMHGIPTDIGSCSECVFRFEIEARPSDGEDIVNDGTCDDYFSEPLTFNYGYQLDYEGHGPSLMYYSHDYFQWYAWIRDGDQIYQTPQHVRYQDGSFSYAGGFLDYYYYSDTQIGGGE